MLSFRSFSLLKCLCGSSALDWSSILGAFYASLGSTFWICWLLAPPGWLFSLLGNCLSPSIHSAWVVLKSWSKSVTANLIGIPHIYSAAHFQGVSRDSLNSGRLEVLLSLFQRNIVTFFQSWLQTNFEHFGRNGLFLPGFCSADDSGKSFCFLSCFCSNIFNNRFTAHLYLDSAQKTFRILLLCHRDTAKYSRMEETSELFLLSFLLMGCAVARWVATVRWVTKCFQIFLLSCHAQTGFQNPNFGFTGFDNVGQGREWQLNSFFLKFLQPWCHWCKLSP